MSVATFYRAIIGELIKDIDKIIYLDGDTLTYGDLTEMYNLDMTDLYFRGIREYRPNMKYTNVTRYICAGVMLMNLNLIRKNKVFEKLKNIIFIMQTKEFTVMS